MSTCGQPRFGASALLGGYLGVGELMFVQFYNLRSHGEVFRVRFQELLDRSHGRGKAPGVRRVRRHEEFEHRP